MAVREFLKSDMFHKVKKISMRRLYKLRRDEMAVRKFLMLI